MFGALDGADSEDPVVCGCAGNCASEVDAVLLLPCSSGFMVVVTPEDVGSELMPGPMSEELP